MAITKFTTYKGIQLDNSYHMIHHYTTSKVGKTYLTIYVYKDKESRLEDVENYLYIYDIDVCGYGMDINYMYHQLSCIIQGTNDI